jgi:hypothetical protein
MRMRVGKVELYNRQQLNENVALVVVGARTTFGSILIVRLEKLKGN